MQTIETVSLSDRPLIDIEPLPPRPLSLTDFGGGTPVVRHFGVALDNDEAQDFIARGWRVFCDEGGPYLVIRLRADQSWPTVLDKTRVSVKFSPVPWQAGGMAGIICWLKEIV